MPSPQVIISERDASQFVLSVSKTVPAILGPATKGEIGVPTTVANERQFIQLFGEPTTSGYGGYAAVRYLRQGNALTFVRVADNSANAAFVEIENQATAASITGTKAEAYYFEDGVNDELALLVDGSINITIDFPEGILSPAQVATQINGQAGSIVTASVATNIVTITSNTAGANSSVSVLTDTAIRLATSNTLNGFTSTAGVAGVRAYLRTSGLTNASTFDIKPDTGSEENVIVVRVDTVTKTIALTTATAAASYSSQNLSSDPANYVAGESLTIEIDGTTYTSGALAGTEALVTSSPFSTSATLKTAILATPGLTTIPSARLDATTSAVILTITSGEVGDTDSSITVTDTAADGAFTTIAQYFGTNVSVATVVDDINSAFGHEVCVIDANDEIKISSDIIGAAGSVKLLDSVTPASSTALYGELGFLLQTVPALGAGEFLTSAATTPANIAVAGADPVAGYAEEDSATVKFTVTGGPLNLIFNIDSAVFDVTVPFANGSYSISQVVDTINTAAGINYASIANTAYLKISSLSTGAASNVEIKNTSSAALLTLLGFTGGDTDAGTDSSPSAKITAISKGTWMNGGTVVVSDTGTKLKVYDPDGKLLETIQNFTYVDTDTNFIETLVTESSSNIVLELDNLFAGTIPDGTYTFAYGIDGENITDAQLVTAIATLADDEQTTHNIIVAPGYSGETVHNKIIDVCEARGDSLMLGDVPFDLTNAQAISWHNGTGNLGRDGAITSNYAALYHPWILASNEFTGASEWMPPTVFVLEQMAISDNISDPWFATAGLNRGILADASDVRLVVNKDDRDLMYADENGNAINPIINIKGNAGGITIWGARTAQRSLSALNRIGPRRMMIFIKSAIKQIARGFLFEPNDDATRNAFIDRANKLLGDVLLRRGISQFSVVMDETNNPPELVAQRILHGDIFVTAVESVEVIEIPFTITAQGVQL